MFDISKYDPTELSYIVDPKTEEEMIAIARAIKVIKTQREELKRLRELARADAEGRLVVLPCKVGDVVYEPFVGKVYEKTVDRIIINRFTTPQIWIETKLPFATPRLERWDMAIGKTVFLTREEAEKALGGGGDA